MRIGGVNILSISYKKGGGKMKRVTKGLAAGLIVACTFLCATGCRFFGNDQADGENGSTTITLYDDLEAEEYKAEYGRSVSVDAPVKKGYYLEGYFDALAGGTKYFDSAGESLVRWEENFPTKLYARWGELSSFREEVTVFGNEAKDGGSSGRRTATIKTSKEFLSAVKGNFDRKLKLEYSVDLKTGSGYEEASPIEFYVKGYDSAGAEKYTVFTHTPKIGEFSTFTGSAEFAANDFTDGIFYATLFNTKKYMGAWAYPVFYSRNLTLTISFVAEE